MSCDEHHCVTCGDDAVPMRVVRVGSAGTALCADGSGATSEVMIDLVGAVGRGDVVLVHAGVALQALPEHTEGLRT